MDKPVPEWPFGDLPKGQAGVILADPPWRFETWGSQDKAASMADRHYDTMKCSDIVNLPVGDLAAENCTLFLWVTWPTIEYAFQAISAWGFTYKTCAFCWIKADGTQMELFRDDIPVAPLMGYWTRANSEACLLATRGKPVRLNADVRQAIIEPRREHSRKPDCVHGRIERLVAGPYVELFARARRPGWKCWGNEVGKFSVPVLTD